jgi:hypothetical protein
MKGNGTILALDMFKFRLNLGEEYIEANLQRYPYWEV